MKNVSRHAVYTDAFTRSVCYPSGDRAAQPLSPGVVHAVSEITRVRRTHACRSARARRRRTIAKGLSQRRFNHYSLPTTTGHSRAPDRRRRRMRIRRPQSTLRHKGSNGVGGRRPRYGRRYAKTRIVRATGARTIISRVAADLAVSAHRGDTASLRASDRLRAVGPQATNDMPNGHTDGEAEQSTEQNRNTAQCERCHEVPFAGGERQ